MNTDNKLAVLTFDYEVFLGRQTGTIENCVIRPTKLILDILKVNNAKAIFFVDATWLLFLKENFNDHFHRIEMQLKEIISSGSSVQLHLHPQWLQAFKTGDDVAFKSYDNYKLHSLTREEINDLFRKSIDLLESITEEKIISFRAGGFCIEPFSQIKEAFENFKIKYDFSVVPGLYLRAGKVYDFDFSKAPELPFYSFQNNTTVIENKGSFIEVPLSTYKNNPVYRIVNKLMLIFKKDSRYGDGSGLQEKSYFSYKTIKGWLQFTKGMLSLDKTINLFFKFLLKIHFSKSGLLVFISHPKTLSPQGLENLKIVVKNYKTLNLDDLDKFISTKESIS